VRPSRDFFREDPMNQATTNRTEVTVVDVQMPFGSMVVFILKWTLASIPALIILGIIGFGIAAVLGGIFTSMVP
jgi:hypothetical protein